MKPALLLFTAAATLAAADIDVRVVERPGPGGFNRTPLAPAAMSKLPVGSIRAQGWLANELDLMRTGMTGRLAELSKFLKPDNGWFGSANEGWEEQPYWFRGFYDLAVLTADPRLQKQSDRWIEAVLSSQDRDGYFGAGFHKSVTGKNGQRLADVWPHMVMLDALVSHCERTGDPRVAPLMSRFFAFLRDLEDPMFVKPLLEGFGDWKPSIQRSRAGDMMPHIFWLYNRTGEAWLLDLAARFYRHIEPPTGTYLDGHVINFTQRFAYPGIFSTLSREPWHLAQTEYWYRLHMETWGQQPRGIFGADENIRPGYVDPRQGFETCGFGEFAKSNYLLGRLTGDPVYADRTEDLLFNHFPASQTPDRKGLHYLTASNQPQLDDSREHEYQNQGRQIIYSPHIYRCCQHNVAMTWPWFAANLWQATADHGLAAWMYASNEVTAKAGREGAEVTIREETDYPFRGSLKFTVVKGGARFPLYLRVPRWAGRFEVTVNQRRVEAAARPSAYVRIERAWAPGDTVEIVMPMHVAVKVWPRTGAVTVDRGPLSYSVKIGERWNRCGGTDEWPEWEVIPTTAWNYGLADLKDFTVTEKPVTASQPWKPENAPVEIRANAKRIPNWKLEKETVAELQASPVRSSEPVETITLIPLGCARLRMSCLPVIGAGREAREWLPPEPRTRGRL